jgi:hypothetical protein
VVHTKTGKFNVESHCKEGVKSQEESRELVVARTSHGLLVAWKAAARLYAFLSPSLSRASLRRYGQGKKEKQRATAAYFSLPSSIIGNNEKETATSLEVKSQNIINSLFC